MEGNELSQDIKAGLKNSDVSQASPRVHTLPLQPTSAPPTRWSGATRKKFRGQYRGGIRNFHRLRLYMVEKYRNSKPAFGY